MPSPPWTRAQGIEAVVREWLATPSIASCFRADRAIDALGGELCPWPDDLAPSLRRALARRGIEGLYLHQREALDHARAGHHVVVATPTASGKSLCFQLPVLDALAAGTEATAIYLYPTKALSRDQETALRQLCADAELALGAVVFDGDTPGDARRVAREGAAVVMTNPDMLHSGILPQHPRWARLFQRLRYVVVDELHTYRGVFGAHVAHVLGRLRRVAAFHGSNPTFICATATIGNPREHAARLLGLGASEIRLIDRSSAPRGPRRVLVYNPPVVNAELGIRASYVKSAVRLALDLLRAEVRTLVFGMSRSGVETMLKYLRDALADRPAAQGAIVAYRGGYLPDARRRVERGLRHGEILGVVATNALELGIDIGDLDAVVCAGYPGSIAECWQRFGRAGRRGEPSLAVLVTSSAPLDQYLAHQPSMLLDGAIEQARIDPGNTEILMQHLKCAAFELPFCSGEPYADLPGPDTGAALGFLAEHGVVHAAGGKFHWAADPFPANHVSLRRVGWDNFVIIDVADGEAIAELDWHSAPSMLHEQAIYQHEGEQYQVERLDYENHKAYVRRVEPDYFTTALRHRKVSVLDIAAERPLCSAAAGWGEVSLVEKVVGYKKIKFYTHENVGYGDVRLPDIEMHSTSFWLTLPAPLCATIGRATALEGLRGLSHALHVVGTLALMCDPRDLGEAIADAPGEARTPADGFAATAHLFDTVPGGVGLAERLYERAPDLVRRTGELIRACPCPLGCPCCVGATAAAAEAAGRLPAAGAPPPEEPAGGRKRAALRVLEAMGAW